MQQTLTPAYGQVSKQADGTFTLIFERRLAHPRSRVWQALADPDQVSRWFAQMTLPKPGESFTLTFMNDSTLTSTLLAKEEPRLIEYTWSSGKDGKPSIVRFELAEDGPNATRLTATHTGLYKNVPDHGDGWQMHLEWLEEVLAGTRTALSAYEDKPNAYLDHYTAIVNTLNA